MKVSDIEGPMLDYWVARATGWRFVFLENRYWQAIMPDGRTLSGFSSPPECLDDSFEPSTDWSHGGPLVEEYGIELWKWLGSDGTYWCSHVGPRQLGEAHYIGPTPLIAAMRALVASKFGEEVSDEPTP